MHWTYISNSVTLYYYSWLVIHLSSSFQNQIPSNLNKESIYNSSYTIIGEKLDKRQDKEHKTHYGMEAFSIYQSMIGTLFCY